MMDASREVGRTNPPASTKKGLLSGAERAQLKRRQQRGKILQVVTFVPVVAGLLLIVFVFAANINRIFSWQVVAPSSSSSGQTFPADEVKNVREGLRLELLAQGETAEANDALFGDAEELRKFNRRNRVDYLPYADGLSDRVYVWSLRDDIEDQYGYLEGRGRRDELLAEARAEDYNFFLNPMLDREFLTRGNSRAPQMAGFYNAIVGTLWVIGLVILFSAVIGVGSAVYLEEYAPKNAFSAFLEVNLRNLAGVPSIVYGILGLYVFVRALSFERSVISAALTLTLLILPVVIIAAREAIRSVPDSLRQASYGLGATKWQTVSKVVLPNAVGGVVTGVILAVARAIGETAPLLLVGGAGLVTSVPGGWDVLKDSFTVMPLQIYTYFGLPNQDAFLPVASAGIVVLLIILIFIYLIAFVIRARFERNW